MTKEKTSTVIGKYHKDHDRAYCDRKQFSGRFCNFYRDRSPGCDLGQLQYRNAAGRNHYHEDCWYAAIIKSANEVCAQMAEYVGGTEAQFIEMMNEKARELGCRNTHFANASGLPDSNHYTTAYDLAKIMRAGLQNPRFRKVISAANYTIPATNLSEARGMHTHMPLMAKESNLYYEAALAENRKYQ